MWLKVSIIKNAEQQSIIFLRDSMLVMRQMRVTSLTLCNSHKLNWPIVFIQHFASSPDIMGVVKNNRPQHTVPPSWVSWMTRSTSLAPIECNAKLSCKNNSKKMKSSKENSHPMTKIQGVGRIFMRRDIVQSITRQMIKPDDWTDWKAHWSAHQKLLNFYVLSVKRIRFICNQSEN